jgi:hypothetical protein
VIAIVRINRQTGATAIPLADVDELRRSVRRTTLVRLLLAAVVVGLVAVCVLLAREAQARPSSYFTDRVSGIAVMDLSTSIDPSRYRRLARILRTLITTSQPVGFVIYSDTAYEALPPGTSGEVLRPMLRFFEAPLTTPLDEFASPGSRRGLGFNFPENPWGTAFRGGTRISAGLRVARQALERDGISRGSVLLISDLDDSPFDTAALTEEAVRFERAGIDLRLVPLRPAREDRELFTRLFGREAFVAHTELLANSALEDRRSLTGPFPLLLVLAAAALLIVAAVNEHVCGRLRWRPAALTDRAAGRGESRWSPA